MNLANIIDAVRARQSLSVNELAKRSKLSPSRVHVITSGTTPNPSISNVRAVLRGLGKSLAWLEKQIEK